MTSKTETCEKCEAAYAPWFEGLGLSRLCRKCAGIRRGIARRRERQAAEAAGEPLPAHLPMVGVSGEIRPKHVRHLSPHTHEWFLAQQVAWETHMARLGIKKVETGEMQRTPAPDVVFRRPRRPVLARSEGRPRHG